MTRLEAFQSLFDHPMYRNKCKQLSELDLQFCRDYLNHRKEMNVDLFAFEVNRMCLDTDKSKNHFLIWELLSSANSIIVMKERGKR